MTHTRAGLRGGVHQRQEQRRGFLLHGLPTHLRRTPMVRVCGVCGVCGVCVELTRCVCARRCTAVQQELLKAEWPEALLDHPGAAEEWGDVDDRVIFRGL